jgi:hypothetical protein
MGVADAGQQIDPARTRDRLLGDRREWHCCCRAVRIIGQFTVSIVGFGMLFGHRSSKFLKAEIWALVIMPVRPSFRVFRIAGQS